MSDIERLRRTMKSAVPTGGYSQSTVNYVIRLLLGMMVLAYTKGATFAELEHVIRGSRK